MLSTITWLNFTEYLCHKWPRICSVCRNHNSVLSLFLTYHWFCSNRNTTGVLCGAGTAYPSTAPEFTPGFKWDLCCSIVSFLCTVLYIILCPFVLFLFSIVVYVLLLLIPPLLSSIFSKMDHLAKKINSWY